MTAVGEAGPTSLPWSGENAVPLLARLIDRLSQHSPRPRLLPETDAMLTALVGANGELTERIARADALHPMLPDLIAPLFVTTVAPTRLDGSTALNVMPAEASVDCDCRPIPGATVDDVRAELVEVLGDDIPYRLEFSGPPEGARSPRSTPRCMRSAETGWHATIPRRCSSQRSATASPTRTICERHLATVAYGIWPLRHTPTAVLHAGVHGRDERVHTADLGYATRFHIEACIEFSRRTGE